MQTSTTSIDGIATALPALSYADLKALAGKVETAMADKRREAQLELDRRHAALAAEFDLDVPRNRRRGAARYRDPDDARHTWSGRGKHPRWLAEKIEAGHDLGEFEVRT